MKRFVNSLALLVVFLSFTTQAWGQAPSTEGQDFWVTFLRADGDDPMRLKLTISAIEPCHVKIENPNTGFVQDVNIREDNLCPELNIDKAQCYSSNSNNLTYTALHVTSDKDISLFAGNYRTKSFDAANILPTSALLDDYIIQTYPASDHEDKEQGSHFAIVAVEDNTTVDYVLTAKTASGKTGAQSVTLKKGQVCYVWTGNTKDDASDLSGTTVKARNGKKIAVFQGCPHTNVPNKVRNRDHIFSQAMPTAYWGTEFGITSSLLRRRDIIAVMAINDGTEVYINDADGEPQLVHTFDFSKDKKHYWTFEIGDYDAYCHSSESPFDGKLESPLVVDSSCYLSTSCPAGVHLIMASNRYDLPTPDTPEPDSDPALLWISPIEQVIKNINFATYNEGINTHYVNIVTTTSNTKYITLDGINITQFFKPITGNPDYSYARIVIPPGSHNLNGYAGFLAHVYGYGDKASYAYSCGSSTIQRSIALNDAPLLIDSVSSTLFCVNEEIEMRLNIGNNEYESVVWNYGDGISYTSTGTSNNEKKVAHHVYTTPGWYDLKVTAVYVNACTGQKHTEDMALSFRVVRPDTIFVDPQPAICFTPEEYAADKAGCDKLIAEGKNDTLWDQRVNCYDTVKIQRVVYGIDTEYEYDAEGRDSALVNGQWYYSSQDVQYTIPNKKGCDSIITCHLKVITCLGLSFNNDSANQHACYGESLALPYVKTKGDIGKVRFVIPGVLDEEVEMDNANTESGTLEVPTNIITKPGKYVAQLQVEDAWCDPLTYNFDIAVYYPSDVFAYKFNNVLAVYKPGKGGNKGWNFNAYQWYRNGEPITGATESVYHLDGIFAVNDEVYVVLTDNEGMQLPSCPITIETVPDFNSQAAVQKRLVNKQMVIQHGNRIYNLYGQRIQ